MARRPKAEAAVRAVVRGEVQGVGFRDATVKLALRLGVMGWVRNGENGVVLVHAEGSEQAVDELLSFLGGGPPAARALKDARFSAKLRANQDVAAVVGNGLRPCGRS